MKKIAALLLAMVMLFGMSTVAGAATDGTYTATTSGMHGPLTVSVTVAGNKIEKVEVVDNVETPGLIDWAVEQVPAQIVEYQSLDVDVVSGVTISSRAIMRAAEQALKDAGMDVDALKAKRERPAPQDLDLTADVIIVGGGGAGLAAAVSATNNGASVILIEKTGFLGGNSIMVGGIYNCPDPDLQDYANFPGSDALVEAALAEEPVSEEHKALQDRVREQYEAYKQTDKTLFDSADWFALQTWNGGDKIATLSIVQELADGSFEGLEWLESMGMEFRDSISFGGGSLYARTHAAVMPNGTGFIKAFRDTLRGRENMTILMDTKGDSLIVDGDKVVGVNATQKNGAKVTLHANNGVILATGGFAGNVELRQTYCEGEKWPDLGKNLITTNMPSVTGDGLFMAQDVGAQLVNMEQIQLLPFCDPLTGATFNIINVNTYINKEGKRFVREDGRRDEMSKGILAQTDGMCYCVFAIEDPNTTYSLGKATLQYYLDNNLYGFKMDTTLEGLAQQLGLPVDTFLATVADFNAHCDSGEVDEFGRVSWFGKIEGNYYVGYPRKPAAHHTMGGVRIDEETHALREDGSIIKGLYCAGEITGVVHGGNRLGGNAVVDFTVFGRIAGEQAAQAK